MKRTNDDYRAMMDLIDIKLKDEDSAYEMIKLLLSNSAKFRFSKMNIFKSESELKAELKQIAEEAIAERRQKLDHEIFLMLQERFHLSPGNLREQFDNCWSQCISQSFEKHYQTGTKKPSMAQTAIATAGIATVVAPVIVIGGVAYDNQLMNIVSNAWKEYLKGVRNVIDKCWSEDKRE